MRLLIPALLALGSVGCAPTEDSFADQYVGAVCSYTQSCARAAFNSAYDDQDECFDLNKGDSDFFVDAGCDFSQENAAKCIAAVNEGTSTCDVDGNDWNACELVWDCF